jgi:hypothetical protein
MNREHNTISPVKYYSKKTDTYYSADLLGLITRLVHAVQDRRK